MRGLAFAFGFILLLSCGSSGKLAQDEHIYWINSLRVSCTGEAPMTCLQVYRGEELDPEGWQFFYEEIGGFDYLEGYVYKLVVREEHMDPATVPADASSIRYELVKVLEKNADPKLRLHDIWVLESLSGEPLDQAMDRPLLEINVGEQGYSGSDGCNRYFGGLVEVDEERIRFGVAAGTRMACPDMKVADQYNSLISEARTYQIAEMRLHLFDGIGREIMVFRKSD